MRCLSIRQPWVWAILHAGKRIENRSWSTNYRGPIAIHAAKGMTKAEYDEFEYWWAIEFPRRPLQTFPTVPAIVRLPRGAIVGTAILDGVVTRQTCPLTQEPWFQGPYGFVLREVWRLPEPIPYKGALGLFDVPDDLLKAAA